MTRQFFTTTRLIRWLLLPILLAGVGGCGRTAKITGKITYQGRAVVCGSVIFIDGKNAARSGVIEADGSYAVDGVSPGAAKIGVISRDPSKGRSVVQGRKPVRPDKPDQKEAGSSSTATEGWFPLARKWENPETSALTCTVGTGRMTHDIDLK